MLEEEYLVPKCKDWRIDTLAKIYVSLKKLVTSLGKINNTLSTSIRNAQGLFSKLIEEISEVVQTVLTEIIKTSTYHQIYSGEDEEKEPSKKANYIYLIMESC